MTFLDGAGIFCGVLKHFLSRSSECPKVLVATHFHDVFTEQLLNPDGVPITFCHMQVIFSASSDTNSESDSSMHLQGNGVGTSSGNNINYLYRVAEGLSLDSHAGECAILCGLPLRIVERAKYVRYDLKCIT